MTLTITMTLVWLIALAVLVLIDIFTMGFICIWFAAGAFVAAIASLLGANVVVQVVVFMLISIILLIFTRPIALKYFNPKVTKTNVAGIIGKEVKVLEEINNFESKGTVMINGVEWTARSSDGEVIPDGAAVKVEKIEGVKAIVKQ